MNKVYNTIDKKFEELRQNSQKALITYIAAGDPDLETTRQLVYAMAEAGADLIEIGVPFSDPIAEGPVITAASERALKNDNVNLSNVFKLVGELARDCPSPLLLMLYANTVYRCGGDCFFKSCAENGIMGVIVPDVPFEEREELLAHAQNHNVHLINMVAPTSEERINTIASRSEGFLYCVSSLGVTGMRSHFTTDFGALFKRIRESSTVPAAIGFGISTPEQVAELVPYCDGVIVGSAIVKLIGEHGRESVPVVAEFVKALKEATEKRS